MFVYVHVIDNCDGYEINFKTNTLKTNNCLPHLLKLYLEQSSAYE